MAHYLTMWDSNLQLFGVLHRGMTALYNRGLGEHGAAQIASNWSKVAVIEMNSWHYLQVVPIKHKVMVKAIPMKVGI